VRIGSGEHRLRSWPRQTFRGRKLPCPLATSHLAR
jgi:hypothetical protein